MFSDHLALTSDVFTVPVDNTVAFLGTLASPASDSSGKTRHGHLVTTE